MSYRGRPSKGCEACRARKIKCDEAKPTCGRCSKTSNECRYRDQGDLLFRNQTTLAAQKAKDSWRKRVKSNQRTDDDCVPDDKSQEASAFDGSMSTLDFDKLKLEPEVRSHLRRLAYERFLYDFVIFDPPHMQPGEPPGSICEFIPKLYEKAPEGSCFATIVDAVAYSNFANRCKAPQARTLSENCIGKGIKLLQKAIADIENVTSDETLCSVYMMGMYENINTPALDGVWIMHGDGANALLQLRSAIEVYSNTVSAGVHDVSFTAMLISCLQVAKAPRIPVKSINSMKQSLPKHYNTAGVYTMQLLHSGAKLHAGWHDIKHSPSPPTSRFDLQEILRAALELEDKSQAWESSIPLPWQYHVERNTPETRSMYDTLWQNLLLKSRGAPEEIHSYPNLRRWSVWGFCRASRLYLLRDLLEILNCMLKLPEPSVNQNPQDAASRTSDNRNPLELNTGALQIQHAITTGHLVHAIEQACSAVASAFTMPILEKSTQDVAGMRGYLVLWPLSAIVAVLKAELVPDSGESSGVTSDSAGSLNQERPPSVISSLSHSSSHHISGPSPSVLDKPQQDGSLPFDDLFTYSSFSNLSSDDITSLDVIHDMSTLFNTDQPATYRHVSDSSLPHPFDSTVNHPALDFSITKPARIDIAARKEWVNRILYYIASELGIKKAFGILTAGSLETIKAQVEEILAQ